MSSGDFASDRERSIAGCTTSHHALIGWLRSLEPVGASTTSLLPGWTVGHVLTHIARNADSMVSLLDGHDQYPHGVKGRNADIESGAGRGWLELIGDVSASADELERRWNAHEHWDVLAHTVTAQVPLSDTPFRRWREVEVHRVDLGLGYLFADMPSETLRLELRRMEMLWTARQPMGMTSLPGAALAAPPPERLAWPTGRVEIEGLGPASIF